MEPVLPECPVCLQVFNNQETIPRVLSCGHSACETCLPQLPIRFHNTIRCPACNQLVNFKDASSLPKNIDLLSFINQQNPNPNSKSSPKQQSNKPSHQEFLLPSLWSDDFYLNWKDYVLSTDSVSIQSTSVDVNDYDAPLLGRITKTCCFKEGETVNLLYVGSSNIFDSVFSFDYTVRILHFLYQLHDSARNELMLILRASAFGCRVCKAYGLWMNLEDGLVFLVCKRFASDFVKDVNELRNEVVCENGEINWGMRVFAMVGLELCEALVSLHSKGLVLGCLAPSCFSFDQFGHVVISLNEVLVVGRRIRKCVAEYTVQRRDDSFLADVEAFVSPEVLLQLLQNEGLAQNCSSSGSSVGHYSDVWSLACILLSFLLGDSFTKKLFKALYYLFPSICEKNCAEFLEMYRSWVDSLNSMLETSLGPTFVSLNRILLRCLEYDPESRPKTTDVWKCIRDLLIIPRAAILVSVDALGSVENKNHCLTLGNFCGVSRKSDRESQMQDGHDLPGNSSATDPHQDKDGKSGKDVVEGLHLGNFESIDLLGHLDCITSLAVGGGYLFGSSFDKRVHVWSLQDFAYVQSFRGHEHRVMDVVYVDAVEPLCISGDSGGGIFVWSIGSSLGQEPLTKWYEQKDWRYSGIHALAAYGSEQIYTGSGDKTIKAWSLRDYNLTCTMTGHKSVVSSLALCDGVLYSGSWDGTIRLWSVADHSPLAILGDEIPGNVTSVLSLAVDHHMLAAAYENGCLKLWRNDVLSRSMESESGAIFAIDIKEKWLFTGGWNKTVDVKELSGDEFHVDTRSVGSIACNSVITALLHWEGRLFVGFADKIVKVYIYRS